MLLKCRIHFSYLAAFFLELVRTQVLAAAVRLLDPSRGICTIHRHHTVYRDRIRMTGCYLLLGVKVIMRHYL
jgi:hypothetical protein